MDTADHVLEVHRHPREIQVAPAAKPTVFHQLTLGAALTTAGELAGIGSDFDHQPGLLELEAPNDEVLDAKEDSE